MTYFELLRKCKDKYGTLSEREEKLIYDAIDIYIHSFNQKEEQFKMELASHIFIRNCDDISQGIRRKEPIMRNSIKLAEMFIMMLHENKVEDYERT